MSNRIIIGPIDSGSSFMLVRTEKGGTGGTATVPMFLNSKDEGNYLAYYWERNMDKISSSMPVFSAAGATGNFFLNDRINSGGFSSISVAGVVPELKIIVNSGTPLLFMYSQDTAATWFPPTQFLSNVKYTIYDPKDTKTPLNIYNNEKLLSAEVIPATDILMLPVVIYTLSGNAIVSLNDPIDTITEWVCMVTGQQTCQLPNTDSRATFLNAYSLLADARKNYLYSYCPPENLCGDSNCNGPCGVFYDDCVSNSQNTFGCIFDPNKYFTESSWWKSTWFVITISVIFGLILIGIILAIVFAIKGKKENDEDIEAGKEPRHKILSPDLEWN